MKLVDLTELSDSDEEKFSSTIATPAVLPTQATPLPDAKPPILPQTGPSTSNNFLALRLHFATAFYAKTRPRWHVSSLTSGRFVKNYTCREIVYSGEVA